MSDLAAIADLFQQVDNSLEDLRELHDSAGEADERDGVARQQRLNEQAYFVLAWGQLEADIDDACRDAIRLGKSHEDWRHRRAWSLYDEENLRLSFRNRLTLVLDRRSDVWQRTLELYEFRNQIAHGDLRHEGINLPTVNGGENSDQRAEQNQTTSGERLRRVEWLRGALRGAASGNAARA